LISAFFVFDLGQYFYLSYLKSLQSAIAEYYSLHPLQTAAIFFLVYVAATGLSLPGAAILTIASGAIFGLVVGTLIASFASSLGATLAFLSSRFVLRDAVMARFGDRLAAINAGIAKDGAFYLFTLRLVPAFPFVVINLLMGLTSIRTSTFYWVSQLGMLLGTIVYVNAGTQLVQLTAARHPVTGADFFLCAARHLSVAGEERRRFLQVAQGTAALAETAQIDRNLIVIGAGSAGLVSAHRRRGQSQGDADRKAAHGRRLSLHRLRALEALIRSAKLLSHIRRASNSASSARMPILISPMSWSACSESFEP
jgi:uncharacterized membrane protein YdjX (TVP38/TMEM64 family)